MLKAAHPDTHLTATVLESQEEHHRTYRQSKQHWNTIVHECGHTVRFGIDATRLETYTDLGAPFDQIQFNFPHWRGKTNTRKNRILIHDFFVSSRKVLKSDGHVHLALMDHQGGAFSTTLREWKHSWMPARLAADLLLIRVEPFEVSVYCRLLLTLPFQLSMAYSLSVRRFRLLQPKYQLSAYKGEDREFGVRGEPQMYIFAAPEASDCRAELDVQLFCHFNVYLQQDHVSEETLFCLQQHVQERLPEGWRGQVFFVRTMQGKTDCLSAYKICFFGETRPILQSDADRSRIIIQDAMIADKIPLVLRRNWVISNVYPSSMLCGIMHADQTRQHGNQ
jgi:hypothetical protein